MDSDDEDTLGVGGLKIARQNDSFGKSFNDVDSSLHAPTTYKVSEKYVLVLMHPRE